MRKIIINQYWAKTGILAVLSAVAVFSTISAYGQSDEKPKADLRVAKGLQKIGYKFAVTPLGNYRVPFTLDDGRGHWVFISSRTEKFGTLETRKVWATVSKSKKLLPRATANKLLMDNIPQKLGAFELTKSDDGYKVLYTAKIEADCRVSSLREAVRLVLFTADAKEKELTGADEF